MPRKPKYYVRPDGLHEAIRVIDGKRVAFRGKSDAEVERKMIEFRERQEKGRTFKAVADEFEERHFPTLAANTLRSYRPALKRAVDKFGDRYIRTVRAPELKEFLAEFARGGRAQKTVNNQRLLLNLVFEYAAGNGDIDFNPCASVKAPGNLPKSFREPASPEDEARIKESDWLLPFFIMYTGLRRGEAMALSWDDIDMDGEVVRVTKSVYHVGGKPFIKEPKTAKGTREVPLLYPLKNRLAKEKKKKGYLFSPDGGKSLLTESQILVLWRQWARRSGVKATPHQIRHSYASMLHELNVDPKDAQSLLGHTTIAMTMDTYTHIREARRKQLGKDLNAALLAAENTVSTQ